MGLAWMLWVLVSLLSVSFTGEHPFLALVTGGLGGCGVGVSLSRQLRRQKASKVSPGNSSRWVCGIQRYELFLLSPFLLVLLFSNRLPLKLTFLPLAFFLFLLICRKRVTGRFFAVTPFHLPILLLLLSSGVGLYASVDLPLSARDVLQLVAGVAVCYGIANHVDSERKVEVAHFLFLAVGATLAFGAMLVMQQPNAKLPLVERIFSLFPNPFPRRIHSNYVGGALTLFLPIAFWCLIFRYKGRVLWPVLAFAITGIGLVLTQSRGALLGTVVALAITGALERRWVRWLLLMLMVGFGLLIYRVGIGAILGPVGTGGLEHTWEGRQELWNRALYIIQDFPFTGIGMHTFPVVTDMLYPLFLLGPNARVPHAHNLYLQVAVDIGIPGFVAFWMLLGAWGGMMWETLKKTDPGSGAHRFRPLALGLVGGMLAHLLYSVTDTIALGEKAGVIFWAVLGMSTAVWNKVREEE